MATPAKRPYQLSGPDHRAITVHVYSGVGARPTVVIPSSAAHFGPRLARAGLAVVELASWGDLDVVVQALESGKLGPAGPPWRALDGAVDEAAVEATLDWFARHLT